MTGKVVSDKMMKTRVVEVVSTVRHPKYGKLMNQKAKYKSTEQWLDACIADAEKKRQAAVAYNHAMDSRLAQLRVKVRDAKAGGNQDELVGECRMIVKILRQRAAMAMATDPRSAPIAKEMRRRTQQMLRNPTSYEAPRH